MGMSIHKNNKSYYIMERIKVNDKWITKRKNIGKNKPIIWYPKLIDDKAESILKTIPDESIDLIITDPPYGISFKGNRCLNEEYDELFNDDSLDFLDGIGLEFERVLKPNSHCYIFTNWISYPFMMKYFDNLKLNTVIVWDKDSGNHGMGDLTDYAPRHEFIMKYSKGRRPLNGKRIPNVIRHNNIKMTGEFKLHPTQKPRGLMEILIEKSSNPGDIVADFYGGSYSVPRAAMRMFRKSIGVELNPGTHKAGVQMVNKDLHKDPVYKFDWTKIKNVDVIYEWGF